MPRVVVDFWDPIDLNGAAYDLLPLCQQAVHLQVRARMKDRGAEYSDYLVEVHADHGRAEGIAARIRKENLPDKANLQTGDVTPLNLLPNEGVAEKVHFLFDRQLQVFLAQRNRFMRAGAVIDLILEVLGLRLDTVDLQPKLRQDAWSRFNRMQRIGKFELKLRGPEHHPDFSQTIPSINRFLEDAGQEINAHSVTLTLSMERARRESLNVSITRRLVQAARRAVGRDREVEKLIVSGGAADGGSETVDFIRDRLVFWGEVPYDGRQLDSDQCRQLLRLALEEHRAYLRSLL